MLRCVCVCVCVCVWGRPCCLTSSAPLPLSHHHRRLSSLSSDYYYESHDEGLRELFPQLCALEAPYLLSDRVNALTSLFVSTNKQSHRLWSSTGRLQWLFGLHQRWKMASLYRYCIPSKSRAFKTLPEWKHTRFICKVYPINYNWYVIMFTSFS